MITIALLFHVIAAVSVGPVLALPLLVRTRAMLAVLKFVRFGALGLLVTGLPLWVLLHLGHPVWLLLALGLYVALCILIAAVVEPAAARIGGPKDERALLLGGSLVSCALTLAIVVLMVVRPGEA